MILLDPEELEQLKTKVKVSFTDENVGISKQNFEIFNLERHKEQTKFQGLINAPTFLTPKSAI